MAKRTLRKIRRKARVSRQSKAAVISRSSGKGSYGKEHLVAKVIGLNAPTNRELEKVSGKAITTVFSAIGRVFSVGDVVIPDFGRLQASKTRGNVKITFTPASGLKKCAKARFADPQPIVDPEPAATPATEPTPAPSPAPSPEPAAQPVLEPTPPVAPIPEPQPAPQPESGPSPVADPGSGPEPTPQPVPPVAPNPEPQPTPQPEPEPSPVPSPPVILEDVARGKPIMAPLSAQGYPVSNAVDGNPDTKWVSGFKVPCWLNIQLGSACRVKRIIARAPDNLSMSCRIKGCIIGHPIQDLIVAPNLTGVLMWDDLDAVISVIEVWFESSSHPSGWVEFIELEVYGVPAQ